MNTETTELRLYARDCLAIRDPYTKCQKIQAYDGLYGVVDIHQSLSPPSEIPGRPDRPLLVDPRTVSQRGVGTAEGRAILLHALTHIEFNAINLALDIVWRFNGMPTAFYLDWWRVASEEAYHFTLLNEHLKTYQQCYGAYPAHDGLWEMAERTQNDLLARIALVPRTLEARGLDVSPSIRDKLAQAGDHAAADIMNIILRDEIGHVTIGNHWYHVLCQEQQLEPISTYLALAKKYRAPALRGPFNVEARLQAGFTPDEISILLGGD